VCENAELVRAWQNAVNLVVIGDGLVPRNDGFLSKEEILGAAG
jgi:hypothetical protein